MPYFPTLNLLFIHIPKTGGTTIESHFKSKMPIKLFEPEFALPNYKGMTLMLDKDETRSSLQHLTYRIIKRNSKLLSIPFDDPKLRIISIVRNPYNRIISDLFWFKLITLSTTPEQVFQVIKKYTTFTGKYFDDPRMPLDNHNIPQYKFVTDESGNLVGKIHIMKTETLNDDLKAFGICDSMKKIHVGKETESKYMSYLNKDSIKLINKHYKEDFKLFNYSMLEV